MKCHEVEELLQRHLDSDLSPEEEIKLFTHTEQCESCAAQLQMLEKLSAGLESLPEVTPPIGIVDSILPKLMELEPAANPQQAEPGLHGRPEISAKPRTTGKRPRRLLWTAVSGVAAAGIALGIYIFDLPETGTQRADLPLREEASRTYHLPAQSESDAGTSSSSQQQESEGHQSPVMGDLSKEIGPAPAETPSPGTDTSQQNKLEEEPEIGLQERSITGMRNQQQEKNDPAAKLPRDNPPAEPEPKMDQQEGPDFAASQQVPDNLTSQDGVQEMKEKSSYGQDTPPAEAERDELSDSTEQAPIVEKSLAGEASEADAGQYGFGSMFMGAEELPSPDGSSVAVIEDRRVTVKDTEGNLLFKSVREWKPEDQLRLVKWLDDRQLIYEVESESGTTSYTVDILEQTEAKN